MHLTHVNCESLLHGNWVAEHTEGPVGHELAHTVLAYRRPVTPLSSCVGLQQNRWA